MTIATQTPAPRSRRWNTKEYYLLGEMGLFDDQRVELIGGRIVQMPPQSDVHAVVVSLARKAIETTFGPGYWVRSQLPLQLSKWSEPEPDTSVVPGDPRDYLGQGHPTGALLVLEVSRLTLKFDRDSKAGLYARFGIADYWVVNLIANQIEVHRDPIPDAAHSFGYRYASITVYQRGQSIQPLAAQAAVKADDLLP